MEAIIQYFEHIPTAHRSIILFGGLAFFYIIENTLPLFKDKYNKWHHNGVNLFFTFTTILINFSMAFILMMAAQYVVEQSVGLFQFFDFPLWVEIIIGLLLFDLVGSYGPHWLEHHVKWMWQFHLIHHTDQHVTATTANRHHPGESIIRFVFTTLAVLILGAPLWMIFMYQSLSVVLTQFNHSNIVLPSWVDKILVLVFCTPNMHHVHHHYRQPYSDTNYGNIFSLWDRVFGTFVAVDNKNLKYGVDTHMDVKEYKNIWTLLKIPFSKYRTPIHYEQKENFTK